MVLPKKLRPPSASATPPAKPVEKKAQRIVLNRYAVDRKLGSGAYGAAFLVKDLKCKEAREEWKVMKEVSVGMLQPDETVDAMHEANLLSKLDNPGIVKYNDSFIDKEHFCIITEFCDGGDLEDIVLSCKKSKEVLEEEAILDWIVQLLCAMRYMHAKRVLHRDLKARNIFLRNGRVKVGDFGISRILMGTQDMASTFTGTPYYMSPEVLKHEGYNSKSDVWSVGCILYRLCTQKHAFDGQGLMGVMYKVVEGAIPKLPELYSKGLNDLLNLMLKRDPEKRPSARDLLKLPFVIAHCKKMSATLAGQITLKMDDTVKLDSVRNGQHGNGKMNLIELQERSEELRQKNMTPRERLRLKKEKEADFKKIQLQQAAKINLVENLHRKAMIRASVQKPSESPWAKLEPPSSDNKTYDNDEDEGDDDDDVISPLSSGQMVGSGEGVHFRPYTAPSPLKVFVNSVREEDIASRLNPRPGDSLPLYRTAPAFFSPSHMSSDDRPITPLRNKMVYNVDNSSLDFGEGIPDDPEAADTYYSQFEDEFEQDAGSDDGDDDEEQATVRPAKGDKTLTGKKDSKLTTADVLVISVDDAPVSDAHTDYDGDIAELINELEVNTSEISDEEDATLIPSDDTVMDNTQTDAFGPRSRAIKIANLRAEGIRKLGKEAFEKVYTCLKESRFQSDGAVSTDADTSVMEKIRKYTTNTRDCFAVDQLLFLEMQAENEGF